MKRNIVKFSLAAALLFGAAGGAFAQAQGYVDPADQARYQEQLRNYHDQQAQYHYERQNYEDRRDAWLSRRESYDDRRARWAADRDQYLRDRAAYDATWGRGSWDQRYDWRDGYVYRR